MQLDDNSRVAVVTGGSRGIGAAIARRLARAGMLVNIVYQQARTEAERVALEINSAGGKATSHKADVSDELEVANLIETIEEAQGGVHVLVNNAGITDDCLVVQMSLRKWDQVIGVNLTGAFLMSRAVLPIMIDLGWGRIINISSNSARMPGAGQAAYAASKGGLEALTRSMAAEVGRKGIRVNAVSPGRVRTDMTAGLTERLGPVDVPGARWGMPDDISGLVGFLASDEADYIQGQTFTVDGGRSLLRSAPRAATAGLT